MTKLEQEGAAGVITGFGLGMILLVVFFAKPFFLVDFAIPVIIIGVSWRLRLLRVKERKHE